MQGIQKMMLELKNSSRRGFPREIKVIFQVDGEGKAIYTTQATLEIEVS